MPLTLGLGNVSGGLEPCQLSMYIYINASRAQKMLLCIVCSVVSVMGG